MANMISIGFINEGCITDHAFGTADELEEQRHQEFIYTMPGYADKTKEEQVDISSMKRHYCLDHKIDNLGKEAVTAMRTWALEEGFVKKNLMGGLCTGKNWVWCAHKLLGIPSALCTDTNLHSTFITWLEGKDKHQTIKILGFLGPLVGDHFWATYFNAVCLYAIR